jgi:hypothetical protein
MHDVGLLAAPVARYRLDEPIKWQPEPLCPSPLLLGRDVFETRRELLAARQVQMAPFKPKKILSRCFRQSFGGLPRAGFRV